MLKGTYTFDLVHHALLVIQTPVHYKFSQIYWIEYQHYTIEISIDMCVDFYMREGSCETYFKDYNADITIYGMVTKVNFS